MTATASARGSRVRLPQGTIAYRAAGPVHSDLPPVVFVHGLLVNGELWREVADLLAGQGIRSYAPDWPLGSHRIPMNAGADLSPRGMASIIKGFLSALELDDVTLVGSDTGGALCQFTIDDDHTRIGRMVLTNCDAFDQFPPPEFARLIALGRHPALLGLLGAALTPTVIRHSRWAYGPTFIRRPDPMVTRRWITPIRTNRAIRRDVSEVMRAMRPEELLDVSCRLHRFTKPVGLVWGDADAYFPVDLARRLMSAFPDSTLTTIPGGRTFVSMEFPAEVAAAISGADRRDG